jgi:hypothetical protein
MPCGLYAKLESREIYKLKVQCTNILSKKNILKYVDLSENELNSVLVIVLRKKKTKSS